MACFWCTKLLFAISLITIANAGILDVTKDIIRFAKKHKDVAVTYFRQVDGNGNLLDRRHPSYGRETQGHINSEISEEDRSISAMRVVPAVAKNGGQVTVSWTGVANTTQDDWVGFYCPATDIPSHYLDYIKVTQSSTWAKGFGSLDVIVYNMRTSCEFRYYRRHGTEGSQLVMKSNPLNFVGGNGAPMHGHIALTGNPSQMRIMWTSGDVSEPVVKFGLSASTLKQIVNAKSRTYKASDMCGPPATTTGFWDPGFIHDALLEDLKPRTRYYYSFGSEKGMSKIQSFITALPAGDRTPFKFIVYGDMGLSKYPGAYTLSNIMKQEVTENGVELIFHNGDISYAEGHAYTWEQWFTLIEQYATLVPYMVSIGNHEQDHVRGGDKDPSKAPKVGFHPWWGNYLDDSGGECGVPMYNRFHMPDNGNYLWWYSFDYGMLHFVVMSTEHDYRPGSRQYNWIENDLKKVDRKKTPWIVIAGHRAMYSSEGIFGDYIVAVHMQEYMEDLIYKYHVDLAFWAHYHSYERVCKVYKGECGEKGVTHFIIGSAGAGLDEKFWFKKKWSMYHEYDWGYGRLSLLNATSMYFEFVRNKDQKVTDSLWIHK